MVIKNDLKIVDTKMLSFDIDGTITQWTSVPNFLASVLSEYSLSYSDEVMKQFFRAVILLQVQNVQKKFMALVLEKVLKY